MDIRFLHEQVRVAYAYGRADARSDDPYVSHSEFVNAARDAGIGQFMHIYNRLADEKREAQA